MAALPRLGNVRNSHFKAVEWVRGSVSDKTASLVADVRINRPAETFRVSMDADGHMVEYAAFTKTAGGDARETRK